MSTVTELLSRGCVVAALLSGLSLSPLVRADSVSLLDLADGQRGFQIIGEGSEDGAGLAVVFLGDINGDKINDFAVGTQYNDNENGVNAGAVYVVFGNGAFPATLNLSDIAQGQGGFKITGEQADDSLVTAASAGDFNHDGLDDLIVGTGMYQSVRAYVVYGKRDTKLVDLHEVAAGRGGFKINGEADDTGQVAVALAGDINDDGNQDLLLSSQDNDEGGEGAGAAYVILGKSGPFTNIDLVDIAAGRGGFKIVGANPGDTTGWSVAGLGDVNGDGIDDLGVDTLGAGVIYVVYGNEQVPTKIRLSDIANNRGGFTAFSSGGKRPLYVARGNDVNADGIGDILIGSDWYSPTAYVVFGRRGDRANLDLDTLAASRDGFEIDLSGPVEELGHSVAPAGDWNRDGYADFLVGSMGDSEVATNSGAAFLVYGKVDTAPVFADALRDGVGGIKFIGAEYFDLTSSPPWGLAGNGDLNGDGIADLLIGAPEFFTNRPGQVYVVFGGTTLQPLRYLDLATLTDINGNGSPELAALLLRPDGQPQVIIKDSVTRQFIRRMDVGTPGLVALGLAGLLDCNGNGSPDVAVLLTSPDGIAKVSVLDGQTGQGIGKLHFFGPGWDTKTITAQDSNQDGTSEVSVLAIRTDGTVGTQIRDAATHELLNWVPFPRKVD